MDLFYPLNHMILRFYLLQTSKDLLSWISGQAALEAALIVRSLRLRLLHTPNKVTIRHVRLDKRNLLFLRNLQLHQHPGLAIHLWPPEFYSDIVNAHRRVHSQLGGHSGLPVLEYDGEA